MELHEIVYTDIILSIDVKASYSKAALNIVRGIKRKNYPDGKKNFLRVPKNNYEPVSAPSTVELDKQS
jgi:hypothetical protein